MNILEPLCMDRRTKEHNQTYVTMYLCQKRTEEHNQSYIIMHLCQKTMYLSICELLSN